MNEIVVPNQKEKSSAEDRSIDRYEEKSKALEQSQFVIGEIVIIGGKYKYYRNSHLVIHCVNNGERIDIDYNMEKVNIRPVEIAPTTANTILTEVQILQISKGHDCIHKLIDMIPSSNLYQLSQISLIFESVDTTLHKIIHSDQFLSTLRIQYILYQTLSAIKYLHSFNL